MIKINTKTKQANIELHMRLADVYKDTEPHYRPENVAHVKEKLTALQKDINAKSLLDIGCGQGFIIDIAKTFFTKIRGIDITQSMLNKVDTSSSNGCDISVSIASAESIPYEENTFDICTAYAVLHHLENIFDAAREAYRVLKPGGIFYSALDPNYYYWDALKALPLDREYHGFLTKEIENVLKKDHELSETYNIPLEVIDTAESFKHIQGGFREENIIRWFKDAGFSFVQIYYEWFMGQGKYIHDPMFASLVPGIDAYLQEMIPVSRHLYKYFSIDARK